MCGLIASIALGRDFNATPTVPSSDSSSASISESETKDGSSESDLSSVDGKDAFELDTTVLVDGQEGDSEIAAVKLLKSKQSTCRRAKEKQSLEASLHGSLDKINHRGPDARGIWSNEAQTVGLAHCRLALNDLSPIGDQPLHSRDGLVHAIVNGEIYDNERLRKLCIDQVGYQFKSHSDSELVLGLYKAFGAPDFLSHLRGEFSFIIYDEENEFIIAARDRYGIKPLFWTVVEDDSHAGPKRLLFASEVKGFLGQGWKPEWDVKSIANGAMECSGEESMFKGVQKLPPAHMVLINADGMLSHKYWDSSYVDHPKDDRLTAAPTPASRKRSIQGDILRVREELIETVRLRLQADVPVGIYLSGGLDSSAIAGIAAHLEEQKNPRANTSKDNRKTECFSISFDRTSGFDESEVAQRTADHLGLHLTRCEVTEAMLADNFEETVWHNERHCLDLGTVGKYCLSRMVHQHGIRAILTGEGADEIFGGYPWFLPDMFETAGPARQSDSQLNTDSELFKTVRSAVASKFSHMMGSSWDTQVSSQLESELGHNYGFVASLLWGSANDVLEPQLQSSLEDKLRVLLDTLPEAGRRSLASKEWHPLHASLYVWSKTQLQSFILTAECDRTEMSHSVEGRPPFLDHRLTELVNSMPHDYKIHHDPELESPPDDSPWWAGKDASGFAQFREKWLLREAAKPFLTDEIINRRKHLYTAPATYPVDGPLWKLVHRLVTYENVQKLGFVNWAVVQPLLGKAFGGDASHSAFRNLVSVAAWVVMSQRFDIPPATSWL